MHRSLANAAFKVGARLRNPSLAEEYERVSESQWSSMRQLADIQLERAVRFFEFVEQHSPYYKAVFNVQEFSARKISSINDLCYIPPVDKQVLIDSNKAIHSQMKFARGFVAETSGTTGRSLQFYKDERWDSINRAYLMRAYDWYDVKPWDRNGYLWGYNISRAGALKARILDALQNRFRIFSYQSEEVRQFAHQLGTATFVGGYSSMLYEVARVINHLDLERPRLKLVKGTSEMILDVYQPEVERAFGRRMVSEYGAAEAGLIAFECPHGKMHINMEDIIVETDESGEVLVTNLASYSFPVIRYRLGDFVRLSSTECSCGRAHPVIDEVAGRRGATVAGHDGQYPALTFYYVFKNLAIQKGILLNYKAVQQDKGLASVLIEGEVNRQFERDIRAELIKYFNEDVDFELRFVPAFERGRGKAQYFESYL